MNCRHICNYLSAYIDGELNGVDHRSVHEHLARCQSCAEEHFSLLQTKRLLERMRVQEPCVTLSNIILHRIDVEENRWNTQGVFAWWSVFSERLQSPVSSFTLVATGSSLALVGFMMLTLLPESSEDSLKNLTASNTAPLNFDNNSTQPQIVSLERRSSLVEPNAPFQRWDYSYTAQPASTIQLAGNNQRTLQNGEIVFSR